MSAAPLLSVVICTCNPRPAPLAATLAALRDQTLPTRQWELIVIDNASSPPLTGRLDLSWHPTARIVVAATLGLTPARLAGIAAARSPLLAFVDDDNVLALDYLAHAVALFAAQPRLGAAGGRIAPQFEAAPPAWSEEFFPLLALRDLGAEPQVTPGTRARLDGYPAFAPVGAGMVLRQECGLAYAQSLAAHPSRLGLDRRGNSLSSGGDNDLVLTTLEAGWQVGYFPALMLTHLIPAGRLEADYLGRLHHDLAKTWVLVLNEHGLRPWPAITPRSVALRKVRAWFRHRAWRGGVARIRWRGACGAFEGRSQLGSR